MVRFFKSVLDASVHCRFKGVSPGIWNEKILKSTYITASIRRQRWPGGLS